MNKRNYLFLLAILMVAMLSVGFVSCGSDSDDERSSVVGTWTGRDGYHRLTVTFNNGGTGTLKSTWDDSKSGSKTYSVDFKYVMESNTEGKITYEELDSYGYETVILYFVVDGKTMTITDPQYHETFVVTKQ